MNAILFPAIDPVFFSIGPVDIRWYALAYLIGFILAWRLCLRFARAFATGPKPQDYDDFLTWAVVGTILGGRLGYVLFYQFDYYLSAPLEALQVWHGGMSFHGGLLGVIAAVALYVRSRKIAFLAFTDILAIVAPIGLFLGRLANFVNGELYGRVADVPWAVIFPRGGDLPRHPSQLYEAGLEGVLLFATMLAFAAVPKLRERIGFLSGIFLSHYALYRFIAEFFREPDPQLGFLFAGATMGQLLCIPMFLVGEALIVRAFFARKNPTEAKSMTDKNNKNQKVRS